VIIGLTGSLGSGKSTVASLLAELGNAKVIDADEIAHRVCARGGSAYSELVKAFGEDILTPEREIDRQKLAKIVFSDDAKRQLLNSIVHPKVREEELRLLKSYEKEPLVVFMVPLLLENQLQHLVDYIVVVVTDDEVRRERLRRRNGWDDSEIQRRLRAQMSDEEKVNFADFVIDNSGTLEETRQQVTELLKALHAFRPSRRTE